MPHKVQNIHPDRVLLLPGGTLIRNGDIAVLSDAEYKAIPAAMLARALLDLGFTTDTPSSQGGGTSTPDAPTSSVASTVWDLGSVSGNVTLDVSSASVFVGSITGSTVFTFVNWPAGPVVPEPTVITKQDGVGHSISFAGITWLPVGSTPVFQTGPNQVNVTTFFSADNGTTVYGQGGSLSGGGFGVYGDGSDGPYVLDGSAPPPGLGKSGSTYYLTRNAFPSSVNILNGYTLQFGGGSTATFRLTCSGTFTIQPGSPGGFAVAFTNTAAVGATGGSNITTGSIKPGANGPNGTTGAGVAGNSVIGGSGSGGRGGASGATTSGSAGTSSLPVGYSLPRALPWAALLAATGPNVPGGIDYFPGGASGSPGSGDGTNAGGGAGQGGNPIHLIARDIINNGTIWTPGGRGAAGTGGNAGGGGGGQGGPIIMVCKTYSGSGLVQPFGGAGGAGVGTGSAGAAGGNGWVVTVLN
jgi:hypothetical protein